MIDLKSSSTWLAGLIDFVYPPLCLGCSEYTEDKSGICQRCLEAIETFDFPICLNCDDFIASGHRCPVCAGESLPLYAFGNYSGPLEQIVIQFKFKGITRSSEFFAGRLAERFGEDIISLGAQALLPIPLHPRRETYRGYNQAEVLARDLSAALGASVMTDVIRRGKKRKPQSRLSLAKRAANIRGVFEVNDVPDDLRRVILVDDVVTSGSTVREAALTLAGADVKVLAVIAIAHAK